MARSKRSRPLLALKPQRWNELSGLLLSAASVLLLMSLISHDPNDLAYVSSSPNPRVHNLCGVAGAWTAEVARLALGWTAFGLPLLGFLWAAARFRGEQSLKGWSRFLSTLLFFLSVSSLFALVGPVSLEAQKERGGLSGLFVSEQLAHYFGWWGAAVVVVTVGGLSLLVATEFAVWPAFSRVGKALAASARWLTGRMKENAAGGVRQLWQAVAELRTAPRVRPAAESDPSRGGGRAPASFRQRGRQPVAEESSEPEPVLRTTQPMPDHPPGGEGRQDRSGGPASGRSSGHVGRPSGHGSASISTAQSGAGRRAQPPALGKASDDRTAPLGPGSKAGPFELPSLDLLNPPIISHGSVAVQDWARNNGRVLEKTLREFGIACRVAEIELGPVVTRYEVEPAPGVKIQKIAGLSDDLALALKSASVRVIAPLPGKGRVGVEVPNPDSVMVTLREVLESAACQESESKLTLALGKDTAGHPLVADLAAMPHLLIAGATGSGKTVCVNGLITSILFRATPEEVRFLMVDPKMVELAAFNGLPHLLSPVVTHPKKVPQALAWIVEEMETRYRLFAKLGVRNIGGYHEKQRRGELPAEEIPDHLPFLVVIIDELADLMLVAQAEIEKAIARLAHLSRAVGIHMVLATQRPSVDVLTGVIKANFPARICFQVASKVDSRTVLDTMGAEKLLGKGDLLFMQPAASKLIRGQGTLVSDEEIERVVRFLKGQRGPSYEIDFSGKADSGGPEGPRVEERDALYDEAVRVVVDSGQASVSLLQRRMRLGYGRAARILDMMEEEGIVGPIRGAKPREVYLKEIPEHGSVPRQTP